jgi:hypothetical protein
MGSALYKSVDEAGPILLRKKEYYGLFGGFRAE